ncbi:hypothetical protein ACFPTR_03790 [Aliibacillus thermotolerans]|uniref:Uncharacterized protein n=1 Tax=Aliibacillus thermotolerans TaxID=1834418 RepID=A0ABW0U4W4_9BACI|nr:hypothetical protein [Aliibacillus thermotolerans]MDA3129427.1 hypothetical protein [Aliibacillus thermotolerans]
MQEETIYGLAGMGFAILLIALGVVMIVSLTKVWQTKIKTTKEEVYQKQAAEAIEAQKESARLNEKLATEMAEMKERITSIEKILKEVE